MNITKWKTLIFVLCPFIFDRAFTLAPPGILDIVTDNNNNKFSDSELKGVKLLEKDYKTVLSLGISTGGNTEIEMAKKNPSVKIIATTIDQNGIIKVKSDLNKLGNIKEQIQVKYEDIGKKMPYGDNTFDLIYARLVLHYLTKNELTNALSEIYRVLKPGGKLYIVVRSVEDWEYKLPGAYTDEETGQTTYPLIYGPGAGKDTRTRMFFSNDSLTEYVVKAGFKVDEQARTFSEKLFFDFERTIPAPHNSTLVDIVALKSLSDDRILDEQVEKGKIFPADLNMTIVVPAKGSFPNFEETLAEIASEDVIESMLSESEFKRMNELFGTMGREQAIKTAFLESCKAGFTEFTENRRDLSIPYNKRFKMWTNPLKGRLQRKHITQLVDRIDLLINESFIDTVKIMKEVLKRDEIIFAIGTGTLTQIAEEMLKKVEKDLNNNGIKIAAIRGTPLIFDNNGFFTGELGYVHQWVTENTNAYPKGMIYIGDNGTQKPFTDAGLVSINTQNFNPELVRTQLSNYVLTHHSQEPTNKPKMPSTVCNAPNRSL